MRPRTDNEATNYEKIKTEHFSLAANDVVHHSTRVKNKRINPKFNLRLAQLHH